MSDITQPGWHPDPLGRHDHRYYDGSTWTEHVADAGAAVEATTPPPPPGATSTPVAVPGTATLVTLSDTPEEQARRKKLGMATLAAAVVLLASLAAPWITGPDDAVTLAGYELSAGAMAGVSAVLLGLYGWQGVAKPRVRYHVAVVILLVTVLPATFFCTSLLTEEEVAKLDAGQEFGESLTDPVNEFIPGVEIEIRTSDVDRVKAESTTEIGLTIALGALIAESVLVGLLWKDDRERRRRAGLLL